MSFFIYSTQDPRLQGSVLLENKSYLFPTFYAADNFRVTAHYQPTAYPLSTQYNELCRWLPSKIAATTAHRIASQRAGPNIVMTSEAPVSNPDSTFLQARNANGSAAQQWEILVYETSSTAYAFDKTGNVREYFTGGTADPNFKPPAAYTPTDLKLLIHFSPLSPSIPSRKEMYLSPNPNGDTAIFPLANVVTPTSDTAKFVMRADDGTGPAIVNRACYVRSYNGLYLTVRPDPAYPEYSVLVAEAFTGNINQQFTFIPATVPDSTTIFHSYYVKGTRNETSGNLSYNKTLWLSFYMGSTVGAFYADMLDVAETTLGVWERIQLRPTLDSLGRFKLLCPYWENGACLKPQTDASQYDNMAKSGALMSPELYFDIETVKLSVSDSSSSTHRDDEAKKLKVNDNTSVLSFLTKSTLNPASDCDNTSAAASLLSSFPSVAAAALNNQNISSAFTTATHSSTRAITNKMNNTTASNSNKHCSSSSYSLPTTTAAAAPRLSLSLLPFGPSSSSSSGVIDPSAANGGNDMKEGNGNFVVNVNPAAAVGKGNNANPPTAGAGADPIPHEYYLYQDMASARAHGVVLLSDTMPDIIDPATTTMRVLAPIGLWAEDVANDIPLCGMLYTAGAAAAFEEEAAARRLRCQMKIDAKDDPVPPVNPTSAVTAECPVFYFNQKCDRGDQCHFVHRFSLCQHITTLNSMTITERKGSDNSSSPSSTTAAVEVGVRPDRLLASTYIVREYLLAHDGDENGINNTSNESEHTTTTAAIHYHLRQILNREARCAVASDKDSGFNGGDRQRDAFVLEWYRDTNFFTPRRLLNLHRMMMMITPFPSFPYFALPPTTPSSPSTVVIEMEEEGDEYDEHRHHSCGGKKVGTSSSSSLAPDNTVVVASAVPVFRRFLRACAVIAAVVFVGALILSRFH